MPLLRCREHHRIRVWAVALIAVLTVPSLASGSRPNVVIILADDHCYRDFGFLGNSQVHTPNIDRLASQSACYPNGYVPMSVCRPSLATILTGLYPHQHGIHFNHPPPGLSVMRRTMTAAEYQATRATTDRLIRRVPTLPRILARHGYACLQTGKHWEGDYRTAGFTHGMTLNRPADRVGPVTGTRLQENGEPVAHGNGDAGLIIGRETMQPIYDFVDTVSPQQPFLIWYAPFLPHTPFDAPQQFRDLYRDMEIAPHLLPYYAEIARFDATVGDLMQFLRRRELDESTIVIFASDNGFRPDEQNHDRHNRQSKLSAHEDGLRTPILIRWTGQTEAGRHDQLVSTVDLVPTILSAVGLPSEITPRMQGISLLPSAMGEQSLPERPAFGAIYPNDAKVLDDPGPHVRCRWVRSGDYKLLIPGPAKPAIARALYNLRSDPEQRHNLIDDAASQVHVAALTTLADDWWTGAASQNCNAATSSDEQ